MPPTHPSFLYRSTFGRWQWSTCEIPSPSDSAVCQDLPQGYPRYSVHFDALTVNLALSPARMFAGLAGRPSCCFTWPTNNQASLTGIKPERRTHRAGFHAGGKAGEASGAAARAGTRLRRKGLPGADRARGPVSMRKSMDTGPSLLTGSLRLECLSASGHSPGIRRQESAVVLVADAVSRNGRPASRRLLADFGRGSEGGGAGRMVAGRADGLGRARQRLSRAVGVLGSCHRGCGDQCCRQQYSEKDCLQQGSCFVQVAFAGSRRPAVRCIGTCHGLNCLN